MAAHWQKAASQLEIQLSAFIFTVKTDKFKIESAHMNTKATYISSELMFVKILIVYSLFNELRILFIAKPDDHLAEQLQKMF